MTNISLLADSQMWCYCLLVTIVAIIGKLRGSIVAARVAGMSKRDAAGLGVLMNTRGMMELVILNIGRDMKIISRPVFHDGADGPRHDVYDDSAPGVFASESGPSYRAKGGVEFGPKRRNRLAETDPNTGILRGVRAMIPTPTTQRSVLGYARGSTNEFDELKRLIMQEGLLEKQPRYYASKILVVWMMLACGLLFLALTRSLSLQLLDAAFLAFVFGQIGFIGHDAGHAQIFRASWKNRVMCLLHGNLLLGISSEWWIMNHNQHHRFPNRLDLDPAVDFAVIAFSEQQARTKQGLLKFVTSYQAYFFFPLLCLTLVGIRIDSIQFLLLKKAKRPLIEALLLAAHFGLYFGFLFHCLGFPHMLLFAAVHQALFGAYVGLTFAPNHKGMPMMTGESRMDFLRSQVLTARNVRRHPVTDFWYGGLNYQIEHHLFPCMPRNNLSESQKLVRKFCSTRSIPYYEASLVQSYLEILKCLHMVSVVAREKRTCQGERDE